MNSCEKEWHSSVLECQKLESLGFVRGLDRVSERINVAVFNSRILSFEIYIDLVANEIGDCWRNAAVRNGVPDPINAIFYFSSDIDWLIDDHDFDSYHEFLKEKISIYVENEWAFTSLRWADDEGFNAAMKAAYEWAWNEFRPLRRWEFQRFLFSHGKKQNNNNGSLK